VPIYLVFVCLNLFLEEKFQNKVDLVSNFKVREDLKQEIMDSVMFSWKDILDI
jgi:predicted DNA-binding protein YlxM (UPF0122 family)